MSTEYKASVGQEYEYDIVVCGGGCAGFAAAIAGARGGAKTVLLEKSHMIGGMSTGGLVGPFMTSFDGRGERQIVKGIFDEVATRLEQEGAAIHPSKVGDGTPYACYYQGYDRRHSHVTPFRADRMQLMMLHMLDEEQVDYLINVCVVDVMMEEKTVKGVVAFDGNDFRIYRAKVVIDCSGDGLVSLKAGAVREECREGKLEVQPMSTFFSVYNVDEQVIEAYISEHPEERGMLFQSYVEKAMEAMDDYPVPRNKVGMYRGVNPGEWGMNCTRIQGLNNTVPEDYVKAYKTGLEQIFFLMDFIRGLPGLQDVMLKEIAPMVGVRESRRIEGVYTLEAEDMIDPPKEFEDSIAMGSFLLDLHPAQGTRAGIDTRPVVANCFQIPYRILVPNAVDGLLVAGRCVSGSRDAMSSIRVMPQAFAMGEAAGTAAAICAKEAVRPRDVDVKALQETLVSHGAVIR